MHYGCMQSSRYYPFSIICSTRSYLLITNSVGISKSLSSVSIVLSAVIECYEQPNWSSKLSLMDFFQSTAFCMDWWSVISATIIAPQVPLYKDLLAPTLTLSCPCISHNCNLITSFYPSSFIFFILKSLYIVNLDSSWKSLLMNLLIIYVLPVLLFPTTINFNIHLQFLSENIIFNLY